ncbi:smoothelin-like 1 [Anguilla rostrata]|uniref:smoothelin-like 1 n=1 Tax=Anguilla rostrata TaxID=7938 RepID=UPI0030CF1B3F
MSSQQKEEIPGVAEAVGMACDSEAGSREGGGASVAMEGETREMGRSQEETESEWKAQKDGGKDAGELTDKCGGGKGVEMGKKEDGKKEAKGEKKGERETKGKEQEGEKRDGQPGGEGVRGDSSEKARVSKGTGLAIEIKKGGKAKDIPKGMEAEKHSKPKEKAGPNPTPTPLGLSRPRSYARPVRGAAKQDIIAKFQQNCPETPVIHNFKVQRTSAGCSNGASIKQKILQWCQNKTRNYEGVCIENFSSSWCDGIAFCALVHRFFPDAFDFSKLRAEERAKNFALAFSTAESLADCCPLLEVEDMLLMGNAPDPLCVFTYVQALCQHLSKIEKERKDREKEEKREGESMSETKEERQGERSTGGIEEGKGEGEKKGERGQEGKKSTAKRGSEKRGEEEEEGAREHEEEATAAK